MKRTGMRLWLHNRMNDVVEWTRTWPYIDQERTWRLPRFDNKPPYVKMDDLNFGYIFGHTAVWVIILGGLSWLISALM
mgnify:CR=1 FL=1